MVTGSGGTTMATRAALGLKVDLQPLQGLWTAAQYLALTDQTDHLIEAAVDAVFDAD